jgi:hypothetical protein
MESSIAEFLMRQSACELLPTALSVCVCVCIYLCTCVCCVRDCTLAATHQTRVPAIAPSLQYAQAPSRQVHAAYLLGLLAMIKCSICSYQCDN